MVPVNCAAIPAALIERRLFGRDATRDGPMFSTLHATEKEWKIEERQRRWL
jgi:transcriptional regulator of acetoin/glycerol metabolism